MLSAINLIKLFFVRHKFLLFYECCNHEPRLVNHIIFHIIHSRQQRVYLCNGTITFTQGWELYNHFYITYYTFIFLLLSTIFADVGIATIRNSRNGCSKNLSQWLFTSLTYLICLIKSWFIKVICSCLHSSSGF